MSDIVDRLGEVGLPGTMAELTSKTWDAVIVGGGHNGLTAAAYLARAKGNQLEIMLGNEGKGKKAIAKAHPNKGKGKHDAKKPAAKGKGKGAKKK